MLYKSLKLSMLFQELYIRKKYRIFTQVCRGQQSIISHGL